MLDEYEKRAGQRLIWWSGADISTIEYIVDMFYGGKESLKIFVQFEIASRYLTMRLARYGQHYTMQKKDVGKRQYASRMLIFSGYWELKEIENFKT